MELARERPIARSHQQHIGAKAAVSNVTVSSNVISMCVNWFVLGRACCRALLDAAAATFRKQGLLQLLIIIQGPGRERGVLRLGLIA